jgi:hypothetical protein
VSLLTTAAVGTQRESECTTSPVENAVAIV